MVAELKLLDNFFFLLMENPSPQDILDFQASEDENERIQMLADKKKADSLTFDETVEIENYFKAEHLVRIAKAKAFGRLNGVRG